MAYVAYAGLTQPNEVIEKMVTYIMSRGYNTVQTLADDLNIYDMASSDGTKYCFQSRSGDYFIVLRSANGTQIFGTNDDATMDVTTPDTNPDYTGVGMVVGESYSPTQRWYNQFKVPLRHKGTEVLGVFMPMKVESGYSYTLYCNNVTEPTDTLVFSLVKENDKYHQCTHLIYADIDKYDEWDGGALFSGSSIKELMGDDVKVFEHELVSDQYILPVLSSGPLSNTFLRIDVDEAPTDVRGNIYWASSGSNNITGKKLSLPIRLHDITISTWEPERTYGSGSRVWYMGETFQCNATHISSNTNNPLDNTNLWTLVSSSFPPAGNGKIPHYYYLQSRDRHDWGRNINTLNCITMDMPIFAAVCVDPDVLENYAAVGVVSGVNCISTLNMQTAGLYERSYPQSGDLDQIFPHGKRRGYYGFDGISVKQETYV